MNCLVKYIQNTYYLPVIIAKKMLKTTKRTIGKIRHNPNPANKLFIIPAILGFENNYDNGEYQNSEENSERNRS